MYLTFAFDIRLLLNLRAFFENFSELSVTSTALLIAILNIKRVMPPIIPDRAPTSVWKRRTMNMDMTMSNSAEGMIIGPTKYTKWLAEIW
jgi:hypothetical protein